MTICYTAIQNKYRWFLPGCVSCLWEPIPVKAICSDALCCCNPGLKEESWMLQSSMQDDHKKPTFPRLGYPGSSPCHHHLGNKDAWQAILYTFINCELWGHHLLLGFFSSSILHSWDSPNVCTGLNIIRLVTESAPCLLCVVSHSPPFSWSLYSLNSPILSLGSPMILPSVVSSLQLITPSKVASLFLFSSPDILYCSFYISSMCLSIMMMAPFKYKEFKEKTIYL